MSGRPRTRSSEPVSCDCGRHVHGTASMYQHHLCGCTPCTDAYTEYRAGRRGFSEPPPPPAVGITGVFVATFPYFGGLSRQRLGRHVRWPFLELAEQHGVELEPGDPVIRVDRTGAGTFVVVSQPARSARPVAEVRRRAAEMAYEHEQAHPLLAKWITKHLQEVAS